MRLRRRSGFEVAPSVIILLGINIQITRNVASRFGLPLQARPEILSQSAMEQPEVISPQEYKLIYRHI